MPIPHHVCCACAVYGDVGARLQDGRTAGLNVFVVAPRFTCWTIRKVNVAIAIAPISPYGIGVACRIDSKRRIELVCALIVVINCDRYAPGPVGPALAEVNTRIAELLIFPERKGYARRVRCQAEARSTRAAANIIVD